MIQNREQVLADKFPFMKDVYIECHSGWHGLIEGMCQEWVDLYNISGGDLNDIEVLQIKEKFGRLSVYAHNLIEGGYDILDKYARLSTATCEVCGKPGKVVGEHWVMVRCDNCIKEG